MTEEYEIAERELINWGILERNRVNEVLPTVDFLVWVNDTMTMKAADGELSYLADVDEVETTQLMSDWINESIVMWTSQKGKDKKLYAKLDVGKHTNIVREIIQDISQRLDERYRIRMGNKRPIYYDEETGVCANPNEGETLEDFHRKIEEYKIKKENEPERHYRTTEEVADIIKQQREKKQEKRLEEKESKKAKSSEFDTKLDGY